MAAKRDLDPEYEALPPELQEKRIKLFEDSVTKPQVKLVAKSTEKTVKKSVKVSQSSSKAPKPASASTDKKHKLKIESSGTVRQVIIKPSQKVPEGSSNAENKNPVRIVKKIVSKTPSKSSSSVKPSASTKVIQKTIIVKKESPAVKGEKVPKTSIPAGIVSAPSTVRKPVKIVTKKNSPAPSQAAVKCVLRGTNPESKALASKFRNQMKEKIVNILKSNFEEEINSKDAEIDALNECSEKKTFSTTELETTRLLY